MSQVNALQIIITVLGSGALFSFLQFLIQRKDSRDEKKIEEQFREIEKKFEDGLEERERVSLERYTEHGETIKEMMRMHERDFSKLVDKFDILKDNDRRLEEKIEQIAVKQQNTCDALIGLAHDKIVYMTDKITERGYITLKEQATLDSIYAPYRTMGGNSHAKAGYEHCRDLEVVSDEEAKRMDDELQVKKKQKAAQRVNEA